MPSTYTPLLRLTLPADGELVGTWGQTVNNGITSLEEAAIAGTASVALVDADYVMSTANGAADVARNAVVRFTGALTAPRNITVPSSSKTYIIRNDTTGGFGLNVKTAAGTGVVVPAGGAMLVYCDGVNVVQAVTTLGAVGPYVLKTGDTMTGSLTVPTITGVGDLGLNGPGNTFFRVSGVTAAMVGGNGYFAVKSGTVQSPSRITLVSSAPFDGFPTNISEVNDSSIRIHAGNGGLPGSMGGVTFVAGTGDGSSGGAAILFRRDGTFGTSLRFYTCGPGTSIGNISERMQIDPNGNVITGTDSTASRLIHGSVIRTGESFLSVAGSGTTLLIGQTSGAVLSAPAAGSVIAQNAAAPLYLGTMGAFSLSLATNNTEKMQITSSGRVLIGDAAPLSGASSVSLNVISNAIYPLLMCNRTASPTLAAFWRCGPDSSNGYGIVNAASTGVVLAYGGTAWAVSSDERLKTELEPIAAAVDKVSTLRAVTGRFITDEEQGYTKRRSFLIAQDVEQVLPEAIYPRDDGMLGLGYTDVIPLLVAAIKELNLRLAALGG